MTTLKSVAIAAGLASSAFGQATSPIVGYTTTSITSQFSDGSAADTLTAPTFVNKVEVSTTVASITGSVVELSASLVADDFNTQPGFPTYYIRAEDGFWANIVSNNATSVTLDAADAAQLTAGESIVIRRHVTLEDYFGDASDNRASLNEGGFNAVGADTISILDLDNNSTLTFFRSNSGIATYLDSLLADSDDFPIQPDQGIQILRVSGGATSLVFAGALEAERQISVNGGVSFLPVVFPTDTTLADLSSLADVLTQVTGFATVGADSVSILSNGVTTTVFPNGNAALPGTWIDSTLGNACLLYTSPSPRDRG